MKDKLSKEHYIAVLSIVAIILIIFILHIIKGNLTIDNSEQIPISTEENIRTNDKGTVSLMLLGNFVINENVLTTYKTQGLQGIIEPKLQEQIQNADIAMVNQGFTVSSAWNQHNISGNTLNIIKDPGINVTCMSNNYYRKYSDDITTTKDSLRKEGIKCVGAADSHSESESPVIYTFNNKTIGFLSVTKLSDDSDTLGYATDSNGHTLPQSGVHGDSDTDSICIAIKNAKKKCNFLITDVSWDTKTMKEDAHKFAEAGADLIVGATDTVMGIEYYKDVPIIYGTGNFLNNVSSLESIAVKVKVNKNNTCSLSIVPCTTDMSYVQRLTGKKRKAFLKELDEMSDGIKISSKGVISK